MEYEDIYARDLQENEIVEETKEYRNILNLTKFSDESVNQPCYSFDLIGGPFNSNYDILETVYSYPIDIYPNGINDGDTDFIAIIILGRELRDYSDSIALYIACTISIIDIEERQRFIRSFCFLNKPERNAISGDLEWQNMVIDRYLSRKTLLDLSDELLPNDTLTLCIELHITEYCSRESFNNINVDIYDCLKFGEIPGERFFLNLNSPLGEKLAKESNVFRQIIEDTINDDTEFSVPNEEFCAFFRIGCILRDGPNTFAHDLDDIIEMYICADKYDVPKVIEYCRKELKSILSENNITRIRELADRFNDDELREHIQTFQKKKGNTSEKYVHPLSPVISDSKIHNFDFYT